MLRGRFFVNTVYIQILINSITHYCWLQSKLLASHRKEYSYSTWKQKLQLKQVVNVIWEKDHRRKRTVQRYSPGCAVCTACNTCLLGPTRVHNPNGISISLAIFAQLTAVSSGMSEHVLCPKLCLLMERFRDPSNAWFLGPTWVQIPNGISIGSAVFAKLAVESRYTSQRVATFPLIIAPFMGTWIPI